MQMFDGMGGGWMMFFWWFLIIVLVVFTFRTLMNFNQNKQNKDTPMEILKRRYAKGEIEEDEFNKQKQELLK